MQRFLFLTIGAIIILVSGYFAYQSVNKTKSTSDTTNPSPWQTYTNSKYGYSVQYPADWVYREYPDTETGAGFQPKSLPQDPANEFITINVYQRPSNATQIPFVEYVKEAAPAEIEGYQSLNSSKEIVTESGLYGYETTWKMSPPLGSSGGLIDSLPITYFDLPSVQPSSTLQLFLNNSSYQDIYQQMIKTVSVK